jgi:integrase
MGSLRKYKNKWRAEARHNKKYVSKTFHSKGDASKWLRETELALEKEQFQDFRNSAHLTLGNLITRYRDEITPNKKGAVSEIYKLNFINRHQIARTKILRLSTKRIIDFKNELRITRAPATVNKYIHYIHTVWETARLNWGILLPPNNPTALVKREKVMTKIDRILSAQEYEKLLDACKQSNLEQLSDIVEFAYLTAMRFGEITKLQVKDIDFVKSLATLHDTKNGESREVPLVQRALYICDKYRFKEKILQFQTSQVLFPIHRDKFRHYFEQACKKAEIKNFRFHDLRACSITNLFKAGWDISSVAVVSGHKSWSELQKYTRIKAIDLVEKINKKK